MPRAESANQVSRLLISLRLPADIHGVRRTALSLTAKDLFSRLIMLRRRLGSGTVRDPSSLFVCGHSVTGSCGHCQHLRAGRGLHA